MQGGLGAGSPQKMINKINIFMTERVKGRDQYHHDNHTFRKQVHPDDAYCIKRSGSSMNETVFDQHIEQCNTLNKDNRWTTLVQLLEDVNIGTTTHYRGYDHNKEVTYSVPVTNEIEPEVENETTRFIVNGKRYSTNMIYYSNTLIGLHADFEPYGSIRRAKLPKDYQYLSGKIRLHGRNIGGLHINMLSNYIRHTSRSYKSLPKYNGTSNSLQYVEIDIGSDKKVEYITLMGRDHTVFSQPNVPRCGEHSIKYVIEKEHHYATKINVKVRNHSSKQWYDIGTFTGNDDRLSEKIFKVDIPIGARFYRIKVISYNGSPSFQIGLLRMEEPKKIKEKKYINYTLISPSYRGYYTKHQHFSERKPDEKISNRPVQKMIDEYTM
jgi:hypothetical protein